MINLILSLALSICGVIAFIKAMPIYGFGFLILALLYKIDFDLQQIKDNK